MKKYDFFALHCAVEGSPTFKTRSGGQKKQTFCKNAQWRAKKLRERGSSTARPTEKGGGGLPIGARPVDFGASFRADSVGFGRFRRVVSCRFGRFRSVSAHRFGRFRRVDFGASIRSISARRFGRVLSMVTDTDTKDKTQKSPIPQSGDRAQLSQGVARS